MRLLPLPGGTIRVRFEADEAHLLDQLTSQLSELLQNYSGTALDADPLFASLEIGGATEVPDDPALARLFPDAHEDSEQASMFRRVTEQGLLNRKLQDATVVIHALGLPNPTDVFGERTTEAEVASASEPVEVMISPDTFAAWVRTLTALRLAVAARIGLESVEDHDRLLLDDDTRGTVLVCDWIAAILESVLSMRDQNPADNNRADRNASH